MSAGSVLFGSMWAPHLDSGLISAEAVSKTVSGPRCNIDCFCYCTVATEYGHYGDITGMTSAGECGAPNVSHELSTPLADCSLPLCGDGVGMSVTPEMSVVMGETVVATVELSASGVGGTSTHLFEASVGSCVTRDCYGASTTVDEATIGRGCIGWSRVRDYVGAVFDTSRMLKGSIGGVTFSVVMSVIEVAPYVYRLEDWVKMPPYLLSHIVNLSVRVVGSVNVCTRVEGGT